MLIDAATLKNPIKPKADSTLNNMRKAELIEYIRCLEHNYNAAVWFNENQARYIERLGLKDIPATIEAEPVRHGRWVDRHGGKYANPYYVCSECKGKALYKYEVDVLDNGHFVQALSDACPHCGAKMDGGS